MDNLDKCRIKSGINDQISKLNGYNKAFLAFNILKLQYKLNGFDLNDFHRLANENVYDGYHGLHNTVIDAILSLQ